MAATTTVKQLIDKVQHFVTSHSIMKDFGYGDYYKIDTVKDRQYPLLWMTLKPSYIKNSSIQYTVDFMFAEILDGEEANLQDCHSDMIQCAGDLVSYFSTLYGYEDWELRMDESNVYIEPFMHLLGNETAGCFLRATFIAPLGLNYCDNPTK